MGGCINATFNLHRKFVELNHNPTQAAKPQLQCIVSPLSPLKMVFIFFQNKNDFILAKRRNIFFPYVFLDKKNKEVIQNHPITLKQNVNKHTYTMEKMINLSFLHSHFYPQSLFVFVTLIHKFKHKKIV